MRYLLMFSLLFSAVLNNCKKEEGEIPRLAKEGKYYEAHHLLIKAGAEEKDKIFEETMIKIEAEYKIEFNNYLKNIIISLLIKKNIRYLYLMSSKYSLMNPKNRQTNHHTYPHSYNSK